MKYIDAEKLKERVTRLITSARQNDWPIAEDYLRRVIDIIESLQQEQSEVDLEKEIRDTCRGYRINDHYEQELGKQDIDNIARYFSSMNLVLNARKK